MLVFTRGGPSLYHDSDRVHIVKGDIRNSNDLSLALQGCSPDVVIHLAALHYIPYCVEHPDETRTINVGGTGNLLACLKDIPDCKYFIMASSAAVYKDKEAQLTETDPLKSIDIYGETKIQCENLVEAEDIESINYRVLRFFNVYGPHDPIPHIIPEIVKQLRDGGVLKLGHTENYRDFIHTTDIASAIVATISPGLERRCTLNIGTGNPISVQEIIRMCESLIKKREPSFVLNSATIDVQKIRPTDRKMLCADIRKISTQTKWYPSISLESGLDELLKVEGVYEAVSRRCVPRSETQAS
ncbi:MAG: NAD(P)-dependent oxidoreductase [Micavibrio sp.]|nr:NAD(P)-dependent oxidoreductase [Micavibrio sp.]